MLTLGAEAEVSRGRAMLVVDGASVHAAVHGGRLHDGQGRRALIPCTAGRETLPVRSMAMRSPGPDCGPQDTLPSDTAGDPGTESSGSWPEVLRAHGSGQQS